jgi:hypothetical protein
VIHYPYSREVELQRRTPMTHLLRYCLSLFWLLFAGSVLVPSVTWGYDGQPLQRISVGYHEVSFSSFNYDSGPTLSANGEANGFAGTAWRFRRPAMRSDRSSVFFVCGGALSSFRATTARCSNQSVSRRIAAFRIRAILLNRHLCKRAPSA